MALDYMVTVESTSLERFALTFEGRHGNMLLFKEFTQIDRIIRGEDNPVRYGVDPRFGMSQEILAGANPGLRINIERYNPRYFGREVRDIGNFTADLYRKLENLSEDQQNQPKVPNTGCPSFTENGL